MPTKVFGQSAPHLTVTIGHGLQWMPSIIFLLGTIYAMCNVGWKGKTFIQFLMCLVSPEYEHAAIMDDVKSSQRLSCRHYMYILLEDENLEEMCGIRQCRNFWGTVFTRQKVSPEEQPVGESEQKTGENGLLKKKVKAEEKQKGKNVKDPFATEIRGEENAWELWDKAKKMERDKRQAENQESGTGEHRDDRRPVRKNQS